MFVRVRDKDTGHLYDVDERAVNTDAHVVLTRFPKTTRARDMKARTSLAGKPARPRGRSAKNQKKETHHG